MIVCVCVFVSLSLSSVLFIIEFISSTLSSSSSAVQGCVHIRVRTQDKDEHISRDCAVSVLQTRGTVCASTSCEVLSYLAMALGFGSCIQRDAITNSAHIAQLDKQINAVL